ncbi:hypothetical protein Ancab_033238 [Ancistrocladus abbreviatus]
MVGTYELSNNQLFLGCVDGHAISVYRLNASNLSKVMEDHFDEEASISPKHKSSKYFSNLKLFGVGVRPAAIGRLRKHLYVLRIRGSGNGIGPSVPQPPPTPPPPPKVSLRQRPMSSSLFLRYPNPNVAFQPSLFLSYTQSSKFTPLPSPGNYSLPYGLVVYGIERFDVNNWYFLDVVGNHDQKNGLLLNMMVISM